MPTAFLTYDRCADHDGRVRQLAEDLEAEVRAHGLRGFTIFMDVRSVPPGAEWPAEIQRAVTEAEALIVVITPGLLRSDWCRREIEAFLGGPQAGAIFPIVWIADPEIRLDADDRLAAALAGRQATAWEALRFCERGESARGRAIVEHRLLLAQALGRRLPLVSGDQAVGRYRDRRVVDVIG